MADERVQACPPSAGYRLRKLLRRNKGPVLAASLVLLALVGGIIGTALALVQAQNEADKANLAREDEATARQRAEAAHEGEKKAHEREKQAQERERQALEQEKEARGQADSARTEAEKRFAESQDRLVRLYVANGARLVEEGDLFGSLPWLAEALKEERGKPDTRGCAHWPVRGVTPCARLFGAATLCSTFPPSGQ